MEVVENRIEQGSCVLLRLRAGKKKLQRILETVFANSAGHMIFQFVIRNGSSMRMLYQIVVWS